MYIHENPTMHAVSQNVFVRILYTLYTQVMIRTN
jgi:hypothetical protein